MAANVSGQAERAQDTGLAALPDAGGVAQRFWIDPSIAAWRPGPWRKVHIEYHTSRHMPRLAERFDADEFGGRLLAAHVNGAYGVRQGHVRLPLHGCTVCFKDFWADFGGLKSPAQMHTEVAAYVSQGARCDIGDQLPPDGRLEPAIYHVIGEAYQHIERIEPYLEQAVPVTEAALLGSGDAPCNEVNYGWVKLLTESRVQFDLVERETKWEDRYALVVLPENFWVDQAMAARLHTFIAGGGAVIAAHTSGVLAGTETSWLEQYGLHYAGMSPFTPAYMVPQVNFTGDIPPYAYALYEGASQWRAESPAVVLALLGEPLFQRSPEHYMSHLQTPFDHTTAYAALAHSGKVALVAFPLGQGYYNQGFWVYRQAFQQALREVLPIPLIQSDAHLTTELSLTHQEANPVAGRNERYMVHIVNFSPVRRTPSTPISMMIPSR